MIQNIKKMLLMSIALSISIEATTLEEFNSLISLAEKDPLTKQGLICERESNLFPTNGDADQCLRAGDNYDNESKKRNLSVKEKSMMGSMYYNAGVMFRAQNHFTKSYKAFEKSIEHGFCDFHQCQVYLDLGDLTYYGEGTDANPMKACQMFRTAFEHGNTKAETVLSLYNCK